MKSFKKIAALVLALCMVVALIPSVGKAASTSVIYFTDLDTAVGEIFTVTGTIQARDGDLGKVSVDMWYDGAFMTFQGGDGVAVKGDGNLTYVGDAGGQDKLEFSMQFQAIQQGNSRIEQGNAVVTNSSGQSISADYGYADIAIGEGDPSKIIQPGQEQTEQPAAASNEPEPITIKGETYTINQDFDDSLLPKGFVRGEYTYCNANYQGATFADGKVKAAYLTNPAGGHDFYIYSEKSQKFYPFERVLISDVTTIILLDGTGEFDMPDDYVPATMEVNGVGFPVWVSPDEMGHFLIYAVSESGRTCLYSYDATEHTYQRIATPQKPKEEEPDTSAVGKIEKLKEFVNEYFIWVLVGLGCFLLILVILLLSNAIKLFLRNREIDRLYEDFGFYDEEEEEPKPTKKNDKKSSKKAKQPEPEYEDDYDDDDYDDDQYDDDQYDEDYDDDQYDDDEYYDDDELELDDQYSDDDYYDDDDLADLREDFAGAEDKYDKYYDDDDFAEEDVQYKEAPKPASKKRKKPAKDDFDMEFIDLD